MRDHALTSPSAHPYVTLEELARVAQSDWRAQFEGMGFSPEEACLLAFEMWRFRSGQCAE